MCHVLGRCVGLFLMCRLFSLCVCVDSCLSWYLPTESRSRLVCICAQIWKNMLSICYFTTFWCFRGPVRAVLLPIPSVDANNIFYCTQFGVPRLCFRGVHFFFFAACNWTN